MKAAIPIPEHMFKRAELQGRKLRLSEREFYAWAVERLQSDLDESALQSLADRGITEEINRATSQAEGPDPVLATIQHRALREDW